MPSFYKIMCLLVAHARLTAKSYSCQGNRKGLLGSPRPTRRTCPSTRAMVRAGTSWTCTSVERTSAGSGWTASSGKFYSLASVMRCRFRGSSRALLYVNLISIGWAPLMRPYNNLPQALIAQNKGPDISTCNFDTLQPGIALIWPCIVQRGSVKDPQTQACNPKGATQRR